MGDTFSLTIDAPELLEDELIALLWAHGGLGSWSESVGGGRVRIHGFVDAGSATSGELARAHHRGSAPFTPPGLLRL